MILLHNIGDYPHSNYNTREQIAACKEQLTFDGIYENVWFNRDLLLNREKPTILFVMGRYIGSNNSFDKGAPKLENYCTATQIMDLVLNYNCVLGYHSYSHADLTTVSDDELMDEITPFCDNPMFMPLPKYFAYPYGIFDRRVVEAVKRYGYEDAFSVDQGNGGPFQRNRRYLSK